MPKIAKHRTRTSTLDPATAEEALDVAMDRLRAAMLKASEVMDAQLPVLFGSNMRAATVARQMIWEHTQRLKPLEADLRVAIQAYEASHAPATRR